MSKRATKKNTGESDAREADAKEREASSKGREAVGAQALYVYCVGERESLAPLFDAELPGAIEGESELELVGDGALAAVVSGVPLADYGEGELPSRLPDAPWTATRAPRHQRGVEHFPRRGAGAAPRLGAI